MARRHTALADDECRVAAGDVPADRVGRFGVGTLEMGVDKDMEGASILWMVAHVESTVPAKERIDTLIAVQSAFGDRGEERIVFSSATGPGAENPIEDDEE